MNWNYPDGTTGEILKRQFDYNDDPQTETQEWRCDECGHEWTVTVTLVAWRCGLEQVEPNPTRCPSCGSIMVSN